MGQTLSTSQPRFHGISDARSKATENAELRNQAFQKSQDCYRAGDHSGAAYWSAKGKEHDRLMKMFNKQAADDAFRQHNASSDLSRIDLHGLHAKEAEARVTERIQECRRAGIKKIEVIVGKGLHSEGGRAILKPAILRLVDEQNLRCVVDSSNSGVLWVELVSREERGLFGWVKSHCTIM